MDSPILSSLMLWGAAVPTWLPLHPVGSLRLLEISLGGFCPFPPKESLRFHNGVTYVCASYFIDKAPCQASHLNVEDTIWLRKPSPVLTSGQSLLAGPFPTPEYHLEKPHHCLVVLHSTGGLSSFSSQNLHFLLSGCHKHALWQVCDTQCQYYRHYSPQDWGLIHQLSINYTRHGFRHMQKQNIYLTEQVEIMDRLQKGTQMDLL